MVRRPRGGARPGRSSLEPPVCAALFLCVLQAAVYAAATAHGPMGFGDSLGYGDPKGCSDPLGGGDPMGEVMGCVDAMGGSDHMLMGDGWRQH